MQAVLLAAGKSQRFWPLNNEHKSQLSLLGKPLVYWTIKYIVESGITDIIIVCGTDSSIQKTLESTLDIKCHITYVTQKEPLGSADALYQAKSFITQPFLVLHPNKANTKELVASLITAYTSQKPDIVICGAKTRTPWEFGCFSFENKIVTKIIENPSKGQEPSDIKNIGIYILPQSFFTDYEKLTSHKEDDLITIINEYLQGKKSASIIVDKEIATLKYPWDSLMMLNEIMQSDMFTQYISKHAHIDDGVTIKGKVYIADNVTIKANTVIEGPCYIGENVSIGYNNVLRGPVNIEKNVVTGSFCEIKNSLIGEDTHFHSGFIGDSVIGNHCRVGGGFITANRKINRDTIGVENDGKNIDTKRTYLGAMVGDNVRMGVRVTTMPGVLIGSGSIIGPATTLFSSINDNTTYYAKFQEVTDKKHTNKVIILDVDHTLFDTETLRTTQGKTFQLFPEVLNILKELAREATLVLFSEGDIAIQKQKLIKTSLRDYVKEENIFIFDSYTKMENFHTLINTYSNATIYFVDNKIEWLSKANQLAPEVTTILIKRDATQSNVDEYYNPDYTIETLTQLPAIIKKI